MYGADIFSIFISPFDDEYLEQAKSDPKVALESIIGRDVVLRMHESEYREAQVMKEQAEQLNQQGDKSSIKFFEPIPYKELINRAERAANQVRRRNEYSLPLVRTKGGTMGESERIISSLAKKSAYSIFANLYNALNEGYVKAFAPQSLTEPIRHSGLEGSFLDDLECVFDLAKPQGKRFSAKGKSSAALAKALNAGLIILEKTCCS
jgi:hypothetical protein